MGNSNFEPDNKNRLLGFKVSGEAFSLAVFSILLLTLILQGVFSKKTVEELNSSTVYLFLSYFLASFGIAVSLFVCQKLTGYRVLSVYKNKKFSPYFAFVIFAVFFGMVFGLGWLNDWFISLLQKIGYNEAAASLPPKSLKNVILCVLFICVIPAIVEETLFRGVILNGLKSLGEVKAILLSAALFSIFHMSPEKTIYQFAAGVLFAIIACKSASIIPSIIIHFLNNFFIVINYYYIGFAPNNIVKIVLLVLGIILLALAVVLLIVKPKLFNKNYTKQSVTIQSGEIKTFVYYVIIGVVTCLIIWGSVIFYA